MLKEWDERYLKGKEVPPEVPSSFLVEMLPLLPKGGKGGRALDVACGAGRNSILLAKGGFAVDAVDYSSVAIEKAKEKAGRQGVSINFVVADLEGYELPADDYDLVINFYYLQRTLVPSIKKALRKGGMLVFETYTLEQMSIGHPRNPDFLLKPNELLRMFSDLHVMFYREGVFFIEGEDKAVASLAARKV